MEDEAAKRREQRRKEREARRQERDVEDAAEDDKRKKDREARRSKRDTGGDEPAEESASSRRRREREAEEKKKAEAEAERQREEERRREEEERREREAKRRRQEEEEEEDRRRMEQEKNRANHMEDEEPEEEEDEEEEEEEETVLDRISPQKKQAILEGLAAELRRIVEERENKNVPASQQELDEIDLKLRSLRTQLRKAEENGNQLNKQKKELEEKLRKNTSDINRLRMEVKKTEEENTRLIKEGKKSAPQRSVKKTLPPKKGNFVNVVRKAQAAAWEEKFMAMKAKQKESNKDPEWARTARERAGSISVLRPKETSEVKPKTKAKPDWRSNSLRKSSRDETKPSVKQSDYWKEARPDWARGKKPIIKPKPGGLSMTNVEKPAAKPTLKEYWKEAKPDWAKDKSAVGKLSGRGVIEDIKEAEKPSLKAADYWQEAKPSWAKGKLPVAKPSTRDIKKIEEKKQYGYPTPDWASRDRTKDKTRDEQDGNKDIRADLESVLGKPRQTVKRRHSLEDSAGKMKKNLREFADHRRSLKVKTKHQPTSNPVRKLLSREDIRSEL